MGFFKDFKEDFSQAVNELMPGDDNLDASKVDEDLVVDTLGDDVDVLAELSKLDELLGQVKPAGTDAKKDEVKVAEAKKEEPKKEEPKKEEPKKEEVKKEEPKPVEQKEVKKEFFKKTEQKAAEPVKQAEAPKIEVVKKEEVKKEEPVAPVIPAKAQEDKKMNENTTPVMPEFKAPVSEEVSVITQGMIINGDVISNGSLDIRGEIHGNVTCNGKLTVTGTITGNSNSSEFFADSARVDGEVTSTGTVKIGLGSVVVGNVTSTSAVIAGAIKGDIDVQGPVVVDTSAVVMGNIKSRSVQINNGAVIEGFCSQAYSDVDVKSLFESKKGN